MVVDSMPSSDADLLFRALGDATRRDIVATVLVREQSVSALARRYPMSVAAVQKHVGVLERAGLVSRRRHGREQLVSGDVTALRRVRAALDGLEELWRGRVDRIGNLLTDPDEGEQR
jgi:DNA-binding transcriptional ArsR family regulator